MKILILIYSLAGGGAERMAVRLSAGFTSRGHKVTVGVFDKELCAYNLPEEVGLVSFEKKTGDGRFTTMYKRVKNLRGHFIENNYDICLAFMTSMISYAVLAKAGSVKIVGAERNNPKFWRNQLQFNIKHFSKMCDGFIFQTKGARNYYPQKTKNNSVIIGNIAPKLSEVKKSPEEVGTPTLCSVARFSKQKDYPTLIKAMRIVADSYPQAKLYIYGANVLENMTDLIEKLGLCNNIICEGFSLEVTKRIQNHDIFVLSSIHEGMPNALMEAMSVGLACVSTDCDFGPSDLIVDGESGYLVPVGDERELSKKIISLIKDQGMRASFGEAARKTMENYSEEKIVSKYIEYFEKVIGR